MLAQRLICRASGKKKAPLLAPDSLVVFLSGGIPKSQLDLLAIYLDVGDIVLKDGRNVDLNR